MNIIDESKEVESILTNAVGKMTENLIQALAQSNKQHRKTGYGLHILENLMNLSYFELSSQLQEMVKMSVHGTEALQYFEAECNKLRNEMISQYNQHKVAALNAALNSASFNLDYCIKNNVTYLPSQLNTHAASVQQHLLTTVSGWFETVGGDGSQPDNMRDEFITELQQVLNNDIEQYKRHLLSASKKSGGSGLVAKSTSSSGGSSGAKNQFIEPQLQPLIDSLKSTISQVLPKGNKIKKGGLISIDTLNTVFNTKYNELEASLSGASTELKSSFKRHCGSLYNDIVFEFNRISNATGSSCASSLSSLTHNLNTVLGSDVTGTTLSEKHRLQLEQQQKQQQVINKANSSAAHNGVRQSSKQLLQQQLAGQAQPSLSHGFSSGGSLMNLSGANTAATTPVTSNTAIRKRKNALLAQESGTAMVSSGAECGLLEEDGDSNLIREERTPSNLGSRRKSGINNGNGAVHNSSTHAMSVSSNTITPVRGTVINSSSSGITPPHSKEHLMQITSQQPKRRKSEFHPPNNTRDGSNTLVISQNFTNSLADAKAEARRSEEERIKAMVTSCAMKVNKKITSKSGK